MPLNTAIITIHQTAHNTQRLDSVQVAEMADLWLDACDYACFERGCIGVTQTKLAPLAASVLWPPRVPFQISLLHIFRLSQGGAFFGKRALKVTKP